MGSEAGGHNNRGRCGRQRRPCSLDHQKEAQVGVGMLYLVGCGYAGNVGGEVGIALAGGIAVAL